MTTDIKFDFTSTDFFYDPAAPVRIHFPNSENWVEFSRLLTWTDSLAVAEARVTHSQDLDQALQKAGYSLDQIGKFMQGETPEELKAEKSSLAIAADTALILSRMVKLNVAILKVRLTAWNLVSPTTGQRLPFSKENIDMLSEKLINSLANTIDQFDKGTFKEELGTTSPLSSGGSSGDTSAAG
jgi:DNA-binding transcriptional MerR regulator